MARKLLWAYLRNCAPTLIFQIWVRLSDHPSALSFVKGLVWALIWPASWIAYLVGYL